MTTTTTTHWHRVWQCPLYVESGYRIGRSQTPLTCRSRTLRTYVGCHFRPALTYLGGTRMAGYPQGTMPAWQPDGTIERYHDDYDGGHCRRGSNGTAAVMGIW